MMQGLLFGGLGVWDGGGELGQCRCCLGVLGGLGFSLEVG